MASRLLFSTIGLFVILGVTNAYATIFTNDTNPNPIVNYTSIPSGFVDLSKSNLIGIQLSQSCMKMLENNISNNCLTYDKLKQFDNTNPSFSGKWVSSPYYHRLNPEVGLAWEYNPNPWVVMVDPDPTYTARAKMIIVEGSTFTWTDPVDKVNNTQLVQHVNRFVVVPCMSATVAPDMFLVNDTLNYLENGCTKTAFNDTQTIQRIETPFIWNNPYASWHYSNGTSANQTGGRGIGDCIHFNCNIKDPYSNSDFYNITINLKSKAKPIITVVKPIVSHNEHISLNDFVNYKK